MWRTDARRALRARDGAQCIEHAAHLRRLVEALFLLFLAGRVVLRGVRGLHALLVKGGEQAIVEIAKLDHDRALEQLEHHQP